MATEKAGQVNQYKCDRCGHTITTVNTHDGTTAMFISCRAPKCEGGMASQWYRVAQDLVPGFAWYRPDRNERLAASEQDHVDRGGLLLRPMIECVQSEGRPKP